MEVQRISLDREQAVLLYRDYKKHLHYSTPIDQEIMRAYQLIAQGKLIIKALDSVVKAGLNEQGFPKLAIARADMASCFCFIGTDGRARLAATERALHYSNSARSLVIEFPAGSFTPRKQVWKAEALSPGIPLNHRPKRGLANYHILWEAEWQRIVPKDPMLLRRIGKGDMWLVLAAWDLTEVERAALAARVH